MEHKDAFHLEINQEKIWFGIAGMVLCGCAWFTFSEEWKQMYLIHAFFLILVGTAYNVRSIELNQEGLTVRMFGFPVRSVSWSEVAFIERITVSHTSDRPGGSQYNLFFILNECESFLSTVDAEPVTQKYKNRCLLFLIKHPVKVIFYSIPCEKTLEYTSALSKFHLVIKDME